MEQPAEADVLPNGSVQSQQGFHEPAMNGAHGARQNELAPTAFYRNDIKENGNPMPGWSRPPLPPRNLLPRQRAASHNDSGFSDYQNEDSGSEYEEAQSEDSDFSGSR